MKKNEKEIISYLSNQKFTIEKPYVPISVQDSDFIQKDSPQNKKMLKVLSQNSMKIGKRLAELDF